MCSAIGRVQLGYNGYRTMMKLLTAEAPRRFLVSIHYHESLRYLTTKHQILVSFLLKFAKNLKNDHTYATHERHNLDP